MSTSGRIHGEFLRLLYILAHQRTQRCSAPPLHPEHREVLHPRPPAYPTVL